MTTLKILNGNLLITIKGFDKIWALKSQITIPLKHITDVQYQPEAARGWWHGFRFPGTNIPNILIAGTFYQKGEWTFWDVHNPEKTIIIKLVNESYHKLIIEVENVKETIEQITVARR